MKRGALTPTRVYRGNQRLSQGEDFICLESKAEGKISGKWQQEETEENQTKGGLSRPS